MIKTKENLDINVNSTLFEIVSGMSERNVLEGVKLLHIVYGIQYKFISKVMGISENSLNMAKKFGTFDGVVKDQRLLKGVLELKMHYLGEDFTYFEEETAGN